MSPDTTTDCCVVGGGPAGLVLALLLARRGRTVQIVDRRERLDAEGASHEPFLSPPSLELLERLGIMDQLLPYGQPVREIVEVDADGHRLSLDYATVPGHTHPYALSVPLLTLTRALLGALERERSVSIMTGASVNDLESDEDGCWSAEVQRDGAVSTLRSDFLIGGDGKFSRMREMAGIGTEVFAFDRPLVLVELALPFDWPERIVAYRDAGGSLTATLPVAGGGLTVLWLADPQEYADLREGPVQGLRQRLASVVPELGAQLLTELTSWDQVFHVNHHVVQPESWSRGNLALLGDSAHGVHSFGAQGLNLALQDALVLADLIGGDGAGEAQPLKAYEAVRRPFVERFQQFQKQLDVLSTAAESAGNEGMYAPISEVMAVGQSELGPMYERVRAV